MAGDEAPPAPPPAAAMPAFTVSDDLPDPWLRPAPSASAEAGAHLAAPVVPPE
jgi:hypothetical protein